MIYILYGPNAYHRYQKLRWIQDTAQQKSGKVDVERFFFDEPEEVDRAILSLRSRDLFSQTHKILIVSGLTECLDPVGLARFCALADHQEGTLLVIYESWGKKNLPKKITELPELSSAKKMFFGALTKTQMLSSARDEAARLGVHVSASVLRSIVDVSSDMWGVVHELEKLSLLNPSQKTQPLFSLGIGASLIGMYEVSKGLLSSSLLTRLSALEHLLVQRDDVYMALAYLAKAASTASSVQKIAHADLSIKRGRLEPEQALMLLALG